jgi:mRNA interferase HigB
LIEFYLNKAKAKEALLKWYFETQNSDWKNYHEIKQTFNSVDSIGNDRYVFDIGGNKYRIIAMVHFKTRTLYLRFVGTHSQYDKINCKTI